MMHNLFLLSKRWLAYCLEQHLFRQKSAAILTAALGVLVLPGCASIPLAKDPLKGGWQYNQDGTVIGLKLGGPEECELRLTRFVNRDLRKDCRYEPNPIQPAEGPAKSYLVYLKDAQGKCDLFADFEFTHDPSAGLVTFMVGDTPFYMQKQPVKN